MADDGVPGGAVIVEVPAGTYLFDSYDRVLMHYRRYDMPALLSLLRTAGSVIERKSHLGLLLYPGFYLVKRFSQLQQRARGEADEQNAVTRQIATSRKSTPVASFLKLVERLLRVFCICRGELDVSSRAANRSRPDWF